MTVKTTATWAAYALSVTGIGAALGRIEDARDHGRIVTRAGLVVNRTFNWPAIWSGRASSSSAIRVNLPGGSFIQGDKGETS